MTVRPYTDAQIEAAIRDLENILEAARNSNQAGEDALEKCHRALYPTPDVPAQRNIVTTYVCPPIPTRSMDWCAHYDGEEEAGGYGWGRTEDEAMQDFIANQEAGR
jgi:hypothetical protein